MLNINSRALDELAARIGKAVEASPARDIEKNVKALLQAGLLRLDLVTRQEFDTQAEVLRRTREKLEALEARVAQMERGPGGMADARSWIDAGAAGNAPAPPMGPAE